MQTLRKTCNVTGDRKIIVNVPEDFGNKVDIIILKSGDKDFRSSIELSKLQENTGFARDILGSPEEDVWNEI